MYCDESFELSDAEVFLKKTGDELLIDVVRGYPVIYDKSLADHKNQLIVNNAWTEIGTVLGLTVKECQERFRRLKQYYSKERVLREKETRSGAGATTRKTWELFESMMFLDKHMIGKNSPYVYLWCRLYQVAFPAFPYNSRAFTSSILESPPQKSDQNTENTEVLEIEKDKNCETEGKQAKKDAKQRKCFNEPIKKRKVDPLEQSFLRMNAGIETIVHNLNNEQHNDAEENFGKLIASELKKKNENERVSLKRKIMDILY